MRLAAFTSAMLACGVVLAGLAEASHPNLIGLGKSLGPAKLGMTEPAVIGALGKPRTVINTNYGGKPIRVARYTVHRGLFEVTYDRKSRRIVGVGTTSSYFRPAYTSC